MRVYIFFCFILPFLRHCRCQRYRHPLLGLRARVMGMSDRGSCFAGLFLFFLLPMSDVDSRAFAARAAGGCACSVVPLGCAGR